MGLVSDIQSTILLALTGLAFLVEVYALVHAARQRPDAFVAASKQTKQFWVIALAVSALVGFVAIGGQALILGIIAIVAAGVYLTDVKPAITEVLGRRSGGSRW